MICHARSIAMITSLALGWILFAGTVVCFEVVVVLGCGVVVEFLLQLEWVGDFESALAVT